MHVGRYYGMKVSHPLAGSFVLTATEARFAALCALPIAMGAAAPWLMWQIGGRLGAGDLAAATLASAAVYLRSLSGLHVPPRIPSGEMLPSRRAGRAALRSIAVCGGLAASLIVPGASALALIDAVGLPRVAGAVQSYDFPALTAAGATLGLTGDFGDVRLAPDGTARLSVGRGARVRVLPWRFVQGGVCIGSQRCLMLDAATGRLRVDRRQVGRVVAVHRAAL